MENCGAAGFVLHTPGGFTRGKALAGMMMKDWKAGSSFPRMTRMEVPAVFRAKKKTSSEFFFLWQFASHVLTEASANAGFVAGGAFDADDFSVRGKILDCVSNISVRARCCDHISVRSPRSQGGELEVRCRRLP